MELINKQRILLMYAGEYNIADERGVNRGLTLNYFFWGENGEDLRTKAAAATGPVGMQRAKCSINYEDRPLITHVPAFYDAGFVMNVGSDGKAVLKVQPGTLKYVGPVEIRMGAGDSPRGAAPKDPSSK